MVLEQSDGSVAGVEVKASASVGASDFAALKTLRNQLGQLFRAGVVLFLNGSSRLATIRIDSSGGWQGISCVVNLLLADFLAGRPTCWTPVCWLTTASLAFGSPVLFLPRVRRFCVFYGLLAVKPFALRPAHVIASTSTELATPGAKAPSPLSALPAHSIISPRARSLWRSDMAPAFAKAGRT